MRRGISSTSMRQCLELLEALRCLEHMKASGHTTSLDVAGHPSVSYIQLMISCIFRVTLFQKKKTIIGLSHHSLPEINIQWVI